MKLEFFYAPTNDLKESLALYRDQLGFAEAWREGETTVSLQFPGTEVQLMLVEEPPGPDNRPGPMFVVDSVVAFAEQRPAGLRVLAEPTEIPGGFIATFEDPSGNAMYVMDQSTESGPE
jgi:predicted enzyme related to lactoylglutathione lyase